MNLSLLKTLVVLSFLSSFCPGQHSVHHLVFAAKLLSQVSVSHKLFQSLSQALLSQFLHKLCQSLCDLNSASISFSKSLLSQVSHKLCQSLCDFNSASISFSKSVPSQVSHKFCQSLCNPNSASISFSQAQVLDLPLKKRVPVRFFLRV